MSIKGPGHFLPWSLDFKIKSSVSQKLLGHLKLISNKSLWEHKNKDELGHMTKMAAMPIYGKKSL